MKTKASPNAHRGSDFRDFLAGEGLLPEVEVLALKRVVSLQLQKILEQEHVQDRTGLAHENQPGIAGPDARSLKPLARKVELRFVPA